MSLNRHLLIALAGIPVAGYAAMATLLVVYGNPQPRGQWIAISGIGGVLLGGVLVLLALVINRRITRELALARHETQRANAAKTDFLADMSHEIRTPLNGIIGFCRLLSGSPLDTRQQEWCSTPITPATP